MRHIVSSILLALVLSVAAMMTAQAQGLPTTTATGSSEPAAPEINPEEMTTEAINAMVARMSDDEVRSVLLDRLDAVASQQAEQVAPKSLVERATNLWHAFSQPLLGAVRMLPALIPTQIQALETFGQTYGGFGGVLTLLVLQRCFSLWVLVSNMPCALGSSKCAIRSPPKAEPPCATL